MARKSRKVENTETSRVALYIRTAMYVRLSVEDSKGCGNSIEVQQNIMEQYLMAKPNFKISKVYIDNGLTGTNFDRPGFQQMLQDIEDGLIDCVVVKDLSRLGRNAIDTGYYIEKYFPLNEVRFISVTDNFDTADTVSSSGGVVLHLKNMINEVYAIEISKKIRAQAQHSMKAGDYIGARPPYGYEKAPDNCHKLIIDHAVAPVVRQIFEWAHSGIGINDIVVKLNEAKILPPSQYGQTKGRINHKNLLGSGVWQTRTVGKILADEVYTGDMVQGKTTSVNKKQIPVPPENWIVVRGTHEPVISRKLYESVQEIRRYTAQTAVSRGKRPYSENILKGKIFCACCGKSLHRQRCVRRKSDDVFVYHCISNSRIAKGTCEGTLIYEKELLPAVRDYLQKKVELVLGKNMYMYKREQALISELETVKAESISLQKSVGENKNFYRNLYENYALGNITATEYKDMKAGYDEKIQHILSTIRELEDKQKQYAYQIERNADLSQSAKAVNENTVLTAELVNKLIDRITVDSSRKIHIDWSFESGFSKIVSLEAAANG